MNVLKELYLAGGCFWGVEKFLALLPGVEETEVGYANGTVAAPTYEEVCSGRTGHAETVRVGYDPQKLPLQILLEQFYSVIDPFSVNRQGADVGTQYRSGIYYTTEADLPAIEASVAALREQFQKIPAIEVVPLKNFYPAEEYHQKYLAKNPGGYCHIGAEDFKRAGALKVAAAEERYTVHSKDELKENLTEMQFAVTQQNATEPPFQNEYFAQFEEGLYVDITTGEPLFSSRDKFESFCGWPSFAKPLTATLVKEAADFSLSRQRTEVRSKLGDAHLGHVFPDGPAALGGLRYCINSAALRFIPRSKLAEEGYGEYLSLFEEKEAHD